MTYRCFWLLTAVLAACSPQLEPVTEKPAVAVGPGQAVAADQVATATVGPVRRVVEQQHIFSDAAVPDIFRLEVRGDSLLRASQVFTITTAAGQEIYRQVLGAGDLEAPLVYELDGVPATAFRRETYVRHQLQRFFNDDQFRSPAVQPKDSFQPGLVSAAVWRSLQQPGTVGFSFMTGKEDGHRIAWVPAVQRVVRYTSFGG